MIDGDDLLEKLDPSYMNGLPVGAQVIYEDDRFVHVKIFVRNSWFWGFRTRRFITSIVPKTHPAFAT